MCLSTVYKNEMTDSAVVMKNVMRIECKDGCVILTDLMERQLIIRGVLESANLVDGFVIVKTKSAMEAEAKAKAENKVEENENQAAEAVA